MTDDIDGASRPGISGQYDIGADEAGIALYRSVGTDSADLNTDSRQVVVSGSTATFAGVMPNNVGVGDAIQYVSGGAYQVAFIHARQSAQVYTVKDWEGNAPLAATLTDCNVYRVYNSLFNWESNSVANVNANIDASVDDYCVMPSTNLTTDNTIAMVPCYAAATADATSTTIDGWATGIGNYIDIYTPTASTEVGTSQRHSGVWGNGYRMDGASMSIDDEYVRVDGIAMRREGGLISISGQTGVGDVYISNCWLNNNSAAGNGDLFTIASDVYVTAYVWNTMGISDSTNTNADVFDYSGGTAMAYFYNCTAIANNSSGFDAVNYKAYIVNCLAYISGSGTGFSDHIAYGAYNASNDGSAPGTGSRTGQAFTFVDAANNNYLLADADEGAKDHGEDLSNDLTISFTTDILGTTRPTGDAWDIGANETPAWWDANWTRRQKLVFDNLSRSENLTSFPVLVVLNSSRIDYSETQNSGNDLRFIDSDGTTELNYEIEDWSESGTSYVWVQVLQVDGSSQSDFMWMYYGNVSASDDQSVSGTWDDNFVMVQHLEEDPSTAGAGGIIDSSKENNNGTDYGTMDASDRVNGKIGPAFSFDGTDDYVTFGQPVTLDFDPDTDVYTMEAWVKTADATGGAIIAKAGPTQAERQYYFYTDGTAGDSTMGLAGWFGGTQIFGVTQNIIDDNWHYVVAVSYLSGGETRINMYVDGIEIFSAQNPGVGANVCDVMIGARRGGNDNTGTSYQLGGMIDETRLSSTDRSNNWIDAQYQSMSDNNFIMWDTLNGGEEKGGGGEYLSMFLLFD